MEIPSNQIFAKEFSHTPLMRAGRARLIRNACAVIANTKWFEGIQSLIELAKRDNSSFVRVHAERALEDLGELADGLDKRRIGNYLVSR